jgi:hypothetical protein
MVVITIENTIVIVLLYFHENAANDDVAADDAYATDAATPHNNNSFIIATPNVVHHDVKLPRPRRRHCSIANSSVQQIKPTAKNY